MAKLRRLKDGAGESGALTESIAWNPDGSFKEVAGHRPMIGCSLRVGSLTARSYSGSDYWLTTPITEILEEIRTDDTDYVRFKTENSEYEWWSGIHPNHNKPVG
jgi:hypothetical protein